MQLVAPLVDKDEEVLEDVDDIGVFVLEVVFFEALFVVADPKALHIAAVEKVNGADETGLAATVVPEEKEIAIQPHTGEVETGAVDEEDLFEHRILSFSSISVLDRRIFSPDDRTFLPVRSRYLVESPLLLGGSF